MHLSNSLATKADIFKYGKLFSLKHLPFSMQHMYIIKLETYLIFLIFLTVFDKRHYYFIYPSFYFILL